LATPINAAVGRSLSDISFADHGKYSELQKRKLLISFGVRSPGALFLRSPFASRTLSSFPLSAFRFPLRTRCSFRLRDKLRAKEKVVAIKKVDATTTTQRGV